MDLHVNPFWIPLGAFMVAIVAIVAGTTQETARVRLKAEQRLAMIARGMSADEIERLLGKRSDEFRVPKDPLRALINTRRIAMILISSGMGLIFFFAALTWVIGEHDILAGAAVGLIPATIGFGFLIDYRMLKRDYARFSLEGEDTATNPTA
jgi:hypothetical protein